MKKILILYLLGFFLSGCNNNTLRQELAPKIEKPQTISITYYLVGEVGDDMSGDISRYLKPVVFQYTDTSISTEQKVQIALDSLFQIKKQAYNKYLKNNLYASDLQVEKIEKEGTLYNIYLSGSIVGLGVMADAFMKPQIEKTIQEYTKQYSIFLGGKESIWRCSLDMKGDCN